MALLTWSHKYSVGVKTLDNQHAAFDWIAEDEIECDVLDQG